MRKGLTFYSLTLSLTLCEKITREATHTHQMDAFIPSISNSVERMSKRERENEGRLQREFCALETIHSFIRSFIHRIFSSPLNFVGFLLPASWPATGFALKIPLNPLCSQCCNQLTASHSLSLSFLSLLPLSFFHPLTLYASGSGPV